MLYILDTALARRVGHPYHFNQGLIAWLKRYRIEHRVVCVAGAEPGLVSEFGAIPLFRHPPGTVLSDDPRVGQLENYIALNRDLYLDLLGFETDHDLAGAALLFPNVNPFSLLGIADWLREASLPAGTDVTLVFQAWSGLVGSPPTDTWRSSLFRHGFLRLRQCTSPRLRLWALDQAAAEEYAALSSCPIEVPPYPTAVDRPGLSPVTPSASPHPTFAFLGDGGWRKGYHLLPEIIRRSSAHRADLRFIVQALDAVPAADGFAAVTADLASLPNVTLIPGFLSDERYMQTIGEADAILLPYQSLEMYGAGTSAVFEETLFLGRAAIVPPDTTMARHLRREPDAGVIAETAEAPAFAEAVIALASDLPRFRAGAVAAAGRRRSTTGLERFVRSMCRHEGPAPA